MTITLNGTTGITTPDVTSSGSLNIDASAPDDSLVVDASGNAGIGTSSLVASNRLTVDGGRLVVSNGPVGAGQASSAKGVQTYFDATNNIGYIYSTQSGVANYRLSLNGNDIDFNQGAARIDSSGNLLVGTTSNPNNEKVLIAATWPQNPLKIAVTSTSPTASAAQFTYGGTYVGQIQLTSTSTSYVTSSDYRLKEDWIAVTDASTRVNALKPVNFAWKATGDRVDGFLAHELAEVVPEAVTGEKDATEMVDVYDEDGNVTGQEERPVYQGIDQAKLVPLLTAALQEALAKIEDLTARVSALEANNV